MIVVATQDFEVYHDVVNELRDRGIPFTTIEPADTVPDGAEAVIVGPTDELAHPVDVEVIEARAGDARTAVEAALSAIRTVGGRTVVGVDPGERPGIAVLAGDLVVAAFTVPLADAPSVIRAEIETAVDPVVRIGDGARLQGATIVNALADVRIELVDETGTTPYLGSGTRGMGDVLAAVNIARREGTPVEQREIEPTDGELGVIQRRSRERSTDNREIDEQLARRVARGELTLDEALAEHRADG